MSGKRLLTSEDELAASAATADLFTARSAARAWSTTVGDEWRILQAGIFAWRALEAYATAAMPRLRLSRLYAPDSAAIDDEAASLAETIGRDAGALPQLEALYFLTSLYPAMLPQWRRSEMGAFYTPPCLVERLVDMATEDALNWSTARVLDPAAGGGAFLVQTALRMKDEGDFGEAAFALKRIGSRLLGLELDVHAAALAQASIEIVLADLIIESGATAPAMVRVGDTLEAKPEAKFDLVIGNPPYGRVTLSSQQRERFARSLYGHANLYGVFTDIALRWAKPQGLIAYLTPTSMLGGQYFAALRSLLASEAPPVSIDFVHARRDVFEDVLQETFLALYRKGARAKRIQVHYLKVRSETQADVVRNGTIGLPNDTRAPWLAPRDPKHSKLIAAVEAMPTRLGDWGYEVATGPLVWNRFKKQLLDNPAKGALPLIWAEAVTSDGRFVFRAEKKNHAPYFRLEPGDGWLRVHKGCVLVQRTTAKEQARRLIAAELPDLFVKKNGGVVVENHLNMVRAKTTPKVSAKVVAAILNSRVVDEVFRCISGSVAVSAFELESLPLPSVDAMEAIEKMLASGASKAKLDAGISVLYEQVGV